MEFDCGDDHQNRFIRRALVEQAAGASTTHVLVQRSTRLIAGFFSLTSAGMDRKIAPKALRSGYPNYYPQLGYIHIGQLARDQRTPEGFGEHVAVLAIARAIRASEIVGAAAITVMAGEDSLISYYENLGFTRVGDTRELYLRMDDAKFTYGTVDLLSSLDQVLS